MIDLAILLAFTLLNMSVALIPGPYVICIRGNAVSRGTAAGVKVCLGIACAALVHVTAAALGVTAFLAAVPTAILAVKLLGAACLVWLGWQMLRRPSVLAAGPAFLRRLQQFAGAALVGIGFKVALERAR